MKKVMAILPLIVVVAGFACVVAWYVNERRSAWLNTPLHRLIYRGDSEALRTFLKGQTHRLSINLKDTSLSDHRVSEATAIMLAAILENHEKVEILLAAGADPSIPDLSNRTPFDWAVMFDDEEVIRVLLADERSYSHFPGASNSQKLRNAASEAADRGCLQVRDTIRAHASQ